MTIRFDTKNYNPAGKVKVAMIADLVHQIIVDRIISEKWELCPIENCYSRKRKCFKRKL